jgi:hypothetical protein
MARADWRAQVAVSVDATRNGPHQEIDMSATVKLAAALALALSFGLPAFAENEPLADAATQEKVTTLMTAQGYEVRQIVTEDGKLEVYALKDGKKHTLYLDADFKIVKID